MIIIEQRSGKRSDIQWFQLTARPQQIKLM
jgi:hypothetical protein